MILDSGKIFLNVLINQNSVNIWESKRMLIEFVEFAVKSYFMEFQVLIQVFFDQNVFFDFGKQNGGKWKILMIFR